MKKALSYYAATATAAPVRPTLQGEQTCDVCVIGAGYSGLSTALHLAEAGLRVIVLEAATVGFGASGRNGGQVINGYSRDFSVLVHRFGADMAGDLMRMNYEGGDIIRGWIDKYRIECDYRHGSFYAAFNGRQMRALEERKKAWEVMDGPTPSMKLFRGKDMAQVVDTKIYYGGLLDRRGGQLHPLNLALGEAAALESLGARVFENSRVTAIDTGDKPRVTTEQGSVNAKHIVVCANAYLGDLLPELSQNIMSVSSQIVTTEVLGEEMVKKMIPGEYCIEDCNFLMDYYRTTADHRLLFGGGVDYTGAKPKNIAMRVKPHITKVFPYLKDKKIDYAWSGNFALTLTRMPQIGRLGNTTYFIQGDSGHGVTTCHLLGKVIAEAINEQIARYDIFAMMKCLPFPGGKKFRIPLTMLGAFYYEMRDSLGI